MALTAAAIGGLVAARGFVGQWGARSPMPWALLSAIATGLYLGAAYLIYLGIRKLLTRDNGTEDKEVQRESLARIYWQGFLVNILNPKTALFFFAFLPQFVNPEIGSVATQSLLLGAIFVGFALLTDGM